MKALIWYQLPYQGFLRISKFLGIEDEMQSYIISLNIVRS